jgi:hypothetical protein
MAHVFREDGMKRRVALVPSLLMCIATIAFPCGGSLAYHVDGPLISAAGFAERGIMPTFDLENLPRDEVRFLPGLLRADSTRFAALIGRPPMEPFAWDTTQRVSVQEPSATELRGAWSRGDLDAAGMAARAIVDRVMALPAAASPVRDSALRLAVETIELSPLVASQPAAARRAVFEQLAAPFRSSAAVSPSAATAARQPSLEYAALREAVRTGLPDDTRAEVTKLVPPARWDSLHAAHRAWLTRHGDHPYAGLVRFARLRLFFLSSQPDSAWRTAVSLSRQYPARAAAEMRYLLVVGFPPSDAVLTDASVPVELRAALVGNLRPSAAAWQSLMQLAADARTARWAEPLEERLMAMQATDTTATTVPAGSASRGSANTTRALPSTFPSWRPSASPFWRYMWAVNMLLAGRLSDAVRLADAPVAVAEDSILSEQAAMLTVRIHVARGDWSRALRVPNVDPWTRRYLLRVLAPDSVADLLRTNAVAALAREARQVLAMRAAQRGAWDEAAQVLRPVDAARAARYTRIGVLARDTTSNAALLQFARGVAAQHGQLFFEATRYFYRGMMYRDYELGPERESQPWDLPWSRSYERQRMFGYLRDGSERYLALRAYASYVARTGVTPAARRAAAREADRVYRGLLATDPSRSDAGYWADSLPGSALAKAIRQAGR